MICVLSMDYNNRKIPVLKMPVMIWFLIISEECGYELKEILQADIDFTDRASSKGF